MKVTRGMLVGLGLGALLVPGSSSVVAARTLKRTCQGATLVRYQLEGKSNALKSPFTFSGEGSSSGAAPSPVKARRRACEKAAKAAADTIRTRQAMRLVCARIRFGRGQITFMGGIGSSKGEKQYVNNLRSPVGFECSNYEPGISACGNGIHERGEGCDDGIQNSDTEPDACRSSCVRAACGDGVADSAEQCDGDDLKGSICSDLDKSGRAKARAEDGPFWGGGLTCTLECRHDVSDCEFCGDGERQSPPEQCDDGNTLDDDGCNTDCSACVSLTPNGQNTNIEVISDTEICTERYDADDYGELGVIIIEAPNLTLDCDGARLSGRGDGIGIYVKRSDNVTITNCVVDDYEIGIYVEDSQNVGIEGLGNLISNTTEAVVLESSTERPPQPPAPGARPRVRSKARALRPPG